MSTPSGSAPLPERLVSLDAFRGLTMLFMASSGFGIAQIAKAHPDSSFWELLRYNTSHAAWIGGGAWDMIQPAFMFMVGMALPFSSSRRAADGQDDRRRLLHTLWRAFALVALGVFLSTSAGSRPNFIFTNVLAQIGLGYVFLTLLVGKGWKTQLGAIGVIAVATWAAFVLTPIAGPGTDFKALGVTEAGQTLDGLWAHWNMNANFAAGFDQWFLNLFPREKPFVFNNGGYQTLNFVPALITMILGLMAGENLRSGKTSGEKLNWLLKAGTLCLVFALVTGTTICPVIKRLWTPSWAFYSGAVVLWAFAAFYWFIDIKGHKAWAFPLVVVGMNSIAIYLAYQLTAGWIRSVGKGWFNIGSFGAEWSALFSSLWVLTVLWTFCYWLWKRKVFIRV
ncbi:MAG: acyltransferase family protein [Verrucomicrobiota bacterium]